MNELKLALSVGLGTLGSFIASLFGGWDSALATLVIFMAIDYITGFLVAAIFKRSDKSKTGALDSKAGWKGLSRKGVTLLIVLVACRLDMILGSSFIKDAVVIGFAANEAVSIVENAGAMGLPIPKVITRAIGALKSKAEDGDE